MATLKKRLAIILAVCLVVMNTVPAFAATDIEPQTDLTETETASPSNAEYIELTESNEEDVELPPMMLMMLGTPAPISTWQGLQAAIDSAGTEETITLTSDIEALADDLALIISSEKNIILDLNGHTIDRNLSEAVSQGYVIKLEGALTIRDSGSGGTITGGKNTGDGGGIFASGSKAQLIMEDGIISGNEAESGAGVYLGAKASFTMKDGMITENKLTANYGGGGVNINGTGTTFTMEDGIISKNEALDYSAGAGVQAWYGTFIMKGGSITENIGGGIRVEGPMTVSGNAVIAGNTNMYSSPDDACVGADDTITVNNPGSGMNIGVWGNAGDKLVQGLTLDQMKYFFADGDDRYLEYHSEDGGYIENKWMCSIHFYRNGHGKNIGTVYVKPGEKATEPPKPEEAGYVFEGWFIDEEFTQQWDFNDPVTERSMILYAKWTESSDPTPKKSSSSKSSTLFTGTWGNAVSNGNWTQDANGVWSYTTTRKFSNTWGYIDNPYAGGQPSWFYFDAYGNMLTGWQFIQGKWYYLNPSKDGTLGACQLGGVTPDGWTVDESGAWVESIPKK